VSYLHISVILYRYSTLIHVAVCNCDTFTRATWCDHTRSRQLFAWCWLVCLVHHNDVTGEISHALNDRKFINWQHTASTGQWRHWAADFSLTADFSLIWINTAKCRYHATKKLVTKSPAVVRRGPTVPPISEGQRPTSCRGKKAISQVTAVTYTLWWRCYIECYNQRYNNLAYMGDAYK